MNLVLLLACYGLTAIIIESNLFICRWVRLGFTILRLGKLNRCYRCLGFWCGLLFAIGYVDDQKLWALIPFASSGVSYVLSKLTPDISLQSVSSVIVADEDSNHLSG